MGTPKDMNAAEAQHALSDSDASSQVEAFFDQWRRIDLAYVAYGRRLGMSASAFQVWDCLCYRGYRNGMSQREICDETGLPRQTVNNVIASFQRDGWVMLDDNAADRRSKTVRLSVEGERRRELYMKPMRIAEVEAMASLNARERKVLLASMRVFGDALAKELETLPLALL